MSTELQTQTASALAPQLPEESLLSIIARIANDPRGANVEVMERLLAMKERIDAQARKELFDAALLRVQKLAPRIQKNGVMDRGPGKGQIAFALREDIDAVMRPIYQSEGFSVTWNSPMSPDGAKIRVVGKFSAHGHTEEREWSCSPDTSGGKQNPQAAGSTVTYGKRYISIMFWDVIEVGRDTNGAMPKDVEPITQNQADDIRTRMNDLPQQRPGGLLAKLCQKHGVSKPEELRVSQLAEVLKDVKNTESMKAAQ